MFLDEDEPEPEPSARTHRFDLPKQGFIHLR